MTTCRICGNIAGHTEFPAREMMFGFRDAFRYLECAQCGCVQIIDPPADLARYYPANYYSFQKIKSENRLRSYLKRKRGAYALTGRGLMGRVLVRRFGTPPEARWAKHVGLTFEDAVLDVGCGAGQNLLNMAALGFRRLHGVDPYIEGDYHYDSGVVVSKRELADVSGSYDFVMFHHSFEHVADPVQVLEQTRRLLRPDRYVLIRTPVAGSHVWRKYGADWVQLDAPRHIFVYSEKAMKILAERCGLVLEDVVYDSTGFQFWGSEQYRRDIPLLDARSVAVTSDDAVFTADELAAFEVEAAALNHQRAGDQACFYLRKP